MYQVWIEGYIVNGNRSAADLKGEFPGASFVEACKAWVASLPDEERKHFNEKQLTYWGCKLFDNETDARKSFG